MVSQFVHKLFPDLHQHQILGQKKMSVNDQELIKPEKSSYLNIMKKEIILFSHWRIFTYYL